MEAHAARPRMIRHATLEQILVRIPGLAIAVVGDLFLDRYLDIDSSLTEPSIETGLDAYQVVRVRASPGAAGTVINNLVALGVKQVSAVAVIGDDGEGYELRQALDRLGVDHKWVFPWPDRRTPTYTKPMLREAGKPAHELNRLDIKNHSPLPGGAEDRVCLALAEVWMRADAVVVVDQARGENCGVVTSRVRERLGELGRSNMEKVIVADSRERIGLFRSVWLKPNDAECRRAASGVGDESKSLEACARELARRAGRPVFCTRGEQGILVVDSRESSERVTSVPAYPVHGLIDIVGAGDSTMAGIVCALAAGVGLEEAAAFGNLVASITIQQIGTTGSATPEQVRQRWHDVSRGGRG
jgi:rfaE bifunctional protein kinase chain/domain